MKRYGKWLFRLFLLGTFVASAQAHDLPISYIDLRLSDDSIDATIEASAKNFARELPGIDEAMLLDRNQLKQSEPRLRASMAAGLTIILAGEKLLPQWRSVELLSVQRNLKVHLRYPRAQRSDALRVHSRLFTSDPRYKTFLNIYQNGALKYQGVFDQGAPRVDYSSGARQKIGAVVLQFLREGIHHIFIGPDHILFIVGLLLLGGTIGQLLKIVTAFTIAHSVTLVLATLNIVTPPPRLIEAAIAVSIIFVGAHALLHLKQERDWRLIFAFGFGFVHGFGFANVLREMDLPRAALGWSLFSFNLGVEIGQACIVLAVMPVLALLYRRSAPVAGKVIAAGSFCVVFAGSFWLMQRLFGGS